MTPAIFFTSVTGLIGAFQVFTQAYIMTNGGPVNSTLFYALYLFRNAFNYLKMGYASKYGMDSVFDNVHSYYNSI